MKKFFCLSLMLFLLPIIVFADDIYLRGTYNNVNAGDVILKDNVLKFYGGSDYDVTYKFYLDNNSINDDVVLVGHSYGYTVPTDVVVKKMNYVSENRKIDVTLYLESINMSEIQVHCYSEGKKPSELNERNRFFDKEYCDDYLEKGKYYSSNDILLLYSLDSYPNYYDINGNKLDYTSSMQISFLYSMNNKETYWAYLIDDNSGYNRHISPTFEEYIPPIFELKCSPKTIKYGEKSTCTLYGTVNYNLTNLNFDFDPKEYKVLGASFPEGIENKEGDKQYNLEISEDYDQSKEGFVLGVFEITGAQNKKYTDDVQIINLDFIDAKVKGKYSNLKDPIEIIALADSTKELREEDNPNTSSSLSIIIPTVLFVVTVVAFFVADNKKKIKNIS